jgi:type VI secretion system protein ImpA
MMKREIDIDAILAAISGDNPAGENLRYTPVYDDIKEARREDDLSDPLLSESETKRADWEKAISLSVDALMNKTKDLQIAAWLTEALIRTEGFEGLMAGLKIMTSFLRDYWDNVYPQIEDGDLDFRAGPLEFMNDKLSLSIKQIPFTDTPATPGYSWYKWQEAHQVGYETDTRNQFGDVDESKKQQRDELIAEGKLTLEDFDAAVERTSKEYYRSLTERLKGCHEEFTAMDETMDEKFGSNAPRTAEIREAIEACEQLAARLFEKKKEKEPDPEPLPQAEEPEAPPEDEVQAEKEAKLALQPAAAGPIPAIQSSDVESLEKTMWQDALKQLNSGGIQKGLDELYKASCSMPSVREKNRYRLLMAKLCLKAERPDLARPILEELYALIEELQLGRWESPMWIAEVFESLYQSLTAGEPSDDDAGRAQELFRRICTIDVTKAMMYRT